MITKNRWAFAILLAAYNLIALDCPTLAASAMPAHHQELPREKFDRLMATCLNPNITEEERRNLPSECLQLANQFKQLAEMLKYAKTLIHCQKDLIRRSYLPRHQKKQLLKTVDQFVPVSTSIPKQLCFEDRWVKISVEGQMALILKEKFGGFLTKPPKDQLKLMHPDIMQSLQEYQYYRNWLANIEHTQIKLQTAVELLYSTPLLPLQTAAVYYLSAKFTKRELIDMMSEFTGYAANHTLWLVSINNQKSVSEIFQEQLRSSLNTWLCSISNMYPIAIEGEESKGEYPKLFSHADLCNHVLNTL